MSSSTWLLQFSLNESRSFEFILIYVRKSYVIKSDYEICITMRVLLEKKKKRKKTRFEKSNFLILKN